jgi:hypothetical protein
MITRADLPPLAREFNAQLSNALDLDRVDNETAAAIKELGGLFLNVIAELENDVIIEVRSRSQQADSSPG